MYNVYIQPTTCKLSPSSAMSTEKNKELFLQQVEQILEGVKQDKEKVTSM